MDKPRIFRLWLPAVLLAVVCFGFALWGSGNIESPAKAGLITVSILIPFVVALLPPCLTNLSHFKNLVLSIGGLFLFLLLVVCFGLLQFKIAVLAFFLCLSFLLFLQGVSLFLVCFLGRPQISRALAMVVGMLLITSIFYLNPVIENIQNEKLRARFITVALYSNPWVVVSSYFFSPAPSTMKLLQQRQMYDLSVIGSYYGEYVPKTYWHFASMGFIVAALALHLLIAVKDWVSRKMFPDLPESQQKD